MSTSPVSNKILEIFTFPRFWIIHILNGGGLKNDIVYMFLVFSAVWPLRLLNTLKKKSFVVFLYYQVIAATNRVDILDPALLRSGRLDRKIEFPQPNEEARARILQIHSRKMNVK